MRDNKRGTIEDQAVGRLSPIEVRNRQKAARYADKLIADHGDTAWLIASLDLPDYCAWKDIALGIIGARTYRGKRG